MIVAQDKTWQRKRLAAPAGTRHIGRRGLGAHALRFTGAVMAAAPAADSTD